ncbi:hypothetical protein Pcinc_004950 [Petrolisthes cinctipes]|uniref:Regulatory protein zeste n=1 Tax=Petrolisthes cinctipes TaxID=88211 RepID=A0AAE1L391_PETCI|nr:hypothetical protein Pcinc_004950 [Petrolisthes cinctipes]
MEESCYLLQLYSDNVHVMRSDFSVQGCTSLTKQMAWETIATKLQQAFPAGKRTVKECQKRWHTILTSSRPKLAKVNGDFTATGGGPPHPPLDLLDELVADILGKENVSI